VFVDKILNVMSIIERMIHFHNRARDGKMTVADLPADPDRRRGRNAER
jgi:hypothetical protein